MEERDLRELRREIDERLSNREWRDEDDLRFYDLVDDALRELEDARAAIAEVRDALFPFDPKESDGDSA